MAVDLNYGIGVEGKNLVLKTLSRVYVKVKDRKYELPFRPEDFRDLIKQYSGNSKSNEDTASIILLNSANDINDLEYPGDGVLILTRDGLFYYTESREYTPITVQLIQNDLNFENLTLSGQLIFTGNGTSLVIPNTNLIQNLNADLLDGYHANQFAIKTANETISGQWKFENLFNFKTAIGSDVLQDLYGQKIKINFNTGEISCNTLRVNEIITPKQEVTFDTVSGIGQEVWVGVQIPIEESNILEQFDSDEYYKISLISQAYNNEELPNPSEIGSGSQNWNLNWWYDLFLESYNENTGNYILRDFSNQDVWNEQNAKFNGTNYSLNDFQNIIDGLSEPDASEFTGPYYSLTISNNVPILSLVPNMIIKDNVGNIGYVVNRDSVSVIIRMLNSSTSLQGDQIISIGSLNRNGGILFNAVNPSLSILKNVLDKNSHSVYFGELSKVDNTKSGIGMLLNGTEATTFASDTTVDNIDNLKTTSEINITNPVIKWTIDGKNNTIITQDGSGYLSGRRVIWTKDNLVMIDSSIRECYVMWSTLENNDYIFSRGNVEFHAGSGFIYDTLVFDGQGVTKNIPIGPAGGSLTGNYPNPSIATGVITENNLSTELREKIESGGSSSADVEELKEQISTLQSNYNDLLSRIITLENTVGTLNTTLENRLNGN